MGTAEAKEDNEIPQKACIEQRKSSQGWILNTYIQWVKEKKSL